MLSAWIAGDCLGDCIACWQLRGVIVHLKDGETIKGHAIWNDAWAWVEYSSTNQEDPVARALDPQKQFPYAIFDPEAKIDRITVYSDCQNFCRIA
jgi:hypothetical protein